MVHIITKKCLIEFHKDRKKVLKAEIENIEEMIELIEESEFKEFAQG